MPSSDASGSSPGAHFQLFTADPPGQGGGSASNEVSNSEERELYRLAAHIAQYDGTLTEILVRAANKRLERNAGVAG